MGHFCNHMQELMETQKKVIEIHIEKHKWYKGIEQKDQAIIDFIQCYGELLRDTFCISCKDKIGCKSYESIIENRR